MSEVEKREKTKKMLTVYAINAGHWLGLIALTVGVALLPKENLRRKKKTATAE